MANRRKSLMPSENITLKNQQDEDINDDEEEKRRRVLGTLKGHITNHYNRYEYIICYRFKSVSKIAQDRGHIEAESTLDCRSPDENRLRLELSYKRFRRRLRLPNPATNSYLYCTTTASSC